MLESLSEKLTNTLRKLRGQGAISESNIEEALREIRLNFLEADVNYKVVKNFISNVKEKAIGQKVLESITPGQQIVKIVHDELVTLMGEGFEDLNTSVSPPAPILFVGLQGCGKTTNLAKLAKYLKEKKKRKPYLVPADIYRPAAIDQLQKLASAMKVPCYPSTTSDNPVHICTEAREKARIEGCDILLIDTAGRLHIDDALMDELKNIKDAIQPSEIIFVADAMTGQDAVNTAAKFNEVLDFSSIFLTKMDGDARGGAALSVKYITGKPIKFIGTGEKPEDIEPFHPDRMASRIMDMGDILSLVEKAQENFDEKKALDLQKKMKGKGFTLEDFKDQLQMIKKMGSLESLMKMIPGMGKLTRQMKDMSPAEDELKKIEAIINSMTFKERQNHAILNGSRRKRIAAGSGTKVQDVNRFIKQFLDMQKMMKKFSKLGKKGMRLPMNPFGM